MGCPESWRSKRSSNPGTFLISSPHRLRGLLAVGSALLGAGLAVYSGAAWPYGFRPDMVGVGTVGALLSGLVLRWPRLAGVGLLLVATAELGLVAGANVRWPFQLAWPFLLIGGALAETARRPDGHQGFVPRVAAEVIAVPLLAFLAVVIAVVLRLNSLCSGSGTC
jgi:hypothetical protein